MIISYSQTQGNTHTFISISCTLNGSVTKQLELISLPPPPIPQTDRQCSSWVSELSQVPSEEQLLMLVLNVPVHRFQGHHHQQFSDQTNTSIFQFWPALLPVRQAFFTLQYHLNHHTSSIKQQHSCADTTALSALGFSGSFLFNYEKHNVPKMSLVIFVLSSTLHPPH